MFWAILAALVLAAIEGLSLVSLHLVERARPGTVLDLFLRDYFAAMTGQDIEDFRTKAFDPELGWNNRPFSTTATVNRAGRTYQIHYGADASRADGLTQERPLVAAYGDSFTLGDEVNDDETWPYFLQELLGKDVRNFGARAYGTDQAVMKFEQHVRSNLIAPVAVLGIMWENINRIANNYRPFYLARTIFKLGFKPRYACDRNDRLTIESNPMQEFRATPAALQALAARAAESDPYAQSKPRLSWPFTLGMLKLSYEYGRSRLGFNSWLFPGDPSFNLWTEPASTHLMRCIVGRFVDTARAHGSTPILLFLPTPDRVPPYRDFVAGLQASRPGVTIVDISKEAFDPARFKIMPNKGHPSAYGNRIIAGALYRAIEGLMPGVVKGAGPPSRP